MGESTRPRLVALAGPGGLPAGALERVADFVDVSVVADVEALRAELPSAEILMIWDFKVRELPEVWHLARSVRWVHVTAAGVNALMFPALRESDVVVTNARGIFEVPMAEYALGLMLYYAKHFDRALENQRRHHWEYYLTETLAGKTLTIVGMGSIGRALAQRARALGMRVVGVRRSGAPDEAADVVYPVERLHQALSEGDHVVVLTPLTDETRGLIGPREIAALKPGAVFINLGRGGVVDEAATVDALRAGRIRGAAFDVFAQEPLPPESPLWETPRFFVSPHLGGDDVGCHERLLDQWAENVRRYVRGEPLLNVIDKRQGY